MNATDCKRSGKPCNYHRFSIVHCLPNDPVVYDHSPGTWNAHLSGWGNAVGTYRSALYEHGMTAAQLRARVAESDRCHDWGLPLLPYRSATD